MNDLTQDYIEQVFLHNDEIQDYISTSGSDTPTELLKLLSDLDWLVMNYRRESKFIWQEDEKLIPEEN